MIEPFELSWLGGATARHFRKVRPGVEDMPWGTLRPSDFPPALVDRARISWTEAAYNEYCTAAAFADLLKALLEARAPVDLIGMASDFVADEIHHVELTARLAMELGGGAPYRVDFEHLSQLPSPALGARQRANELVVRICSVGEAFSVPMLAGCLKSATHPLVRQVLERIVQDEAPHGRFGVHYLEWAADDLDDAERARLAQVALDTLRAFAPLWQRLRSKVVDGVTTEGFLLSHVHQLGWMESSAYAERAKRAVRDEVVTPLSRFGIELDRAAVEALVGPAPPASGG